LADQTARLIAASADAAACVRAMLSLAAMFGAPISEDEGLRQQITQQLERIERRGAWGALREALDERN
jgi:mannitol-1-phosphate/altronate dehydrogenase